MENEFGVGSLQKWGRYMFFVDRHDKHVMVLKTDGGDQHLTINEARMLRDWLTEMLPEVDG